MSSTARVSIATIKHHLTIHRLNITKGLRINSNSSKIKFIQRRVCLGNMNWVAIQIWRMMMISLRVNWKHLTCPEKERSSHLICLARISIWISLLITKMRPWESYKRNHSEVYIWDYSSGSIKSARVFICPSHVTKIGKLLLKRTWIIWTHLIHQILNLTYIQYRD